MYFFITFIGIHGHISLTKNNLKFHIPISMIFITPQSIIPGAFYKEILLLTSSEYLEANQPWGPSCFHRKANIFSCATRTYPYRPLLSEPISKRIYLILWTHSEWSAKERAALCPFTRDQFHRFKSVFWEEKKPITSIVEAQPSPFTVDWSSS